MQNNTAKHVQLIMIAVLAVISALMTVRYIMTGVGSFDDFLSLAFHVLETVIFVMIGIYVGKGYSKDAAGFFKLQLCFLTVLFVLRVVKSVLHGTAVPLGLNIAVIACLCILLLWKDLGEKRSWAVFAILVLLQVTMIVPSIRSGIPGRIIDDFVLLALFGNLGLMIKGKYDDKKARGRL